MAASPPIARARRVSPAVRRLVAVVFVLLGVSWFAIANYLPEGAILWTIARGHGVTVGDLPGVAMFVVAVVVLRPIASVRRAWRGR